MELGLPQWQPLWVIFVRSFSQRLASMRQHSSTTAWFGTYNFLQAHIPLVIKDENIALYLLREALIGFCASVVSDTISNSLRVIKTYKQVNPFKISYSMLLSIFLPFNHDNCFISRRSPKRHRFWRNMWLIGTRFKGEVSGKRHAGLDVLRSLEIVHGYVLIKRSHSLTSKARMIECML